MAGEDYLVRRVADLPQTEIDGEITGCTSARACAFSAPETA